ncbi:MAG: filamentous hemagglutinin N-terminal domain-containing protein, partial [Rhodoferax sp.]|nr:filamentous hemagglutinin N-terminal domain-containing protein [Rhodoferax sp.]
MVHSGSRILRVGKRRHALAIALAAAYGVAPPLALANPGGAVVVHGQASMQTQGNRLTVTNTPGAIINWQQFSIGAGETTYFQQQNAASTVLNRVQTQNPALRSQIDGTLGSNGRVFLINPNGVVFGPGSVIDTQGFVASTLSLNDDDFKAGKFRFVRDGAAGDIQVQGRISSGNGDVYLIAPNVGTDGNAVIRSEGGNVVLAAGEMVEITGRNLNDISFEVQNQGNGLINLGRLEGGAVGVFAGTLKHSGVVQAQTLAREGGRLVLKAQGDVHVAADSQARADGLTVGGTVTLASQSGHVTVDGGAQISASATAASPATQASTVGGSIAVTADAGFVALEAGSRLSADGGRGGDIQVSAARLVQDGAVHADGSSSMGGTIRLQA